MSTLSSSVIKALLLCLLIFASSPEAEAAAMQYLLSDAAAEQMEGLTKESDDEQRFYLDKQWNPGKVYLVNGEVLENFLLKFDLRNLRLEIKHGNEISICHDRLYTGFEWADSETGEVVRYVKRVQYDERGQRLGNKLFEVRFAGTEAQLLKRIELEVRTRSQVELSPYESAKELSRKESYFMLRGEELFCLHPRKAKRNYEHFGAFGRQVRSYVEDKQLEFDNPAELQQIIRYYDSLL